MRCVPLAVILLLIAMQSVGNAQDQGDLRNSLQSCINDAVSAGNFDKARMGQRGTLVVRCTDQLAREMYMSLGRGVPERNVTFPNRDKGAERKFGLSMCFSVKEKADGTPTAEFSCRIAISVGAAVLELF